MFPKLYLDFTQGLPLPPALKCTRSGNANYFDRFGRLRTIGANLPRVGVNGLCIEPQSTNEFIWSRDLTRWTKTGTATVAQATSLDGTSQNIRVTSMGGTSVEFTRAISLTGTYVLSFYAGITGPLFSLTLAFGGVTQTIKPGYNYLVGTNPTAVTITASGSSLGSASFTIDCLQVESGRIPTTPIHTAGATATRNADEVWIDINQAALNNWFNDAEGIFLVDVKPNELLAEQCVLYLCEAADPTVNYFRMGIQRNPTTQMVAGYGTTQTLNYFSSCDTPGLQFRMGSSYISGEQLFSMYGRTNTNNVTSTVSTNFTDVDRLYLGRTYNGGAHMAGNIQRLAFYDSFVDQENLNQLTYQ